MPNRAAKRSALACDLDPTAVTVCPVSRRSLTNRSAIQPVPRIPQRVLATTVDLLHCAPIQTGCAGVELGPANCAGLETRRGCPIVAAMSGGYIILVRTHGAADGDTRAIWFAHIPDMDRAVHAVAASDQVAQD